MYVVISEDIGNDTLLNSITDDLQNKEMLPLE